MFCLVLSGKCVNWAIVDADAAIDAGVFVDFAESVNRKRVLRALVYAHTTGDAFVSIDVNSHVVPNLSFSALARLDKRLIMLHMPYRVIVPWTIDTP